MRALVVSVAAHGRRARMRADNPELALEFVDGVAPPLDPAAFAIMPRYTDRVTGRVLTEGEVGCLMGHARAWRLVADGRAGAYGLILEDDVVAQPGLPTRLAAIVAALPADAWELLYVARKPLADDVCAGPVDGVVVPGYSYWACAYALTRAGARRLLEARPLRRAMPVDEWLPAACGVGDPRWRREVTVGLRALSLDPLGAAPRADAWAASATECSLGADTQMHGLMAFTVATAANDGYRALCRSARRYGVRLRTLAMGAPWEGAPPHAGRSGAFKARQMRDAVRELPADAAVLFVDGYDVLVNDGLARVAAALDGCDALFAAERRCWPDEALAPRFPQRAGGYRFLNSGCYVARAGPLREMLDTLQDEDDDDQALFTRAMLSGRWRVRLDHACALFQTLADVDESDIVVDHVRSVVTNRRMRTRPVLVHANGPRSKLWGSRLAAYAAWSALYGPLTPPRAIAEDAPPAVFVSCVVRDKAHALPHMLRSLRALRYPAARLHLHFVTNDNRDATADVLRDWVAQAGAGYADVRLETESRACSLAHLREHSLGRCRAAGVRFFLTWDGDAVLDNADTLRALLRTGSSIVAPLLHAERTSAWTNCWGAFDAGGMYARSMDYLPIVQREVRGVFAVALVRDLYLLDLRRWPGASHLDTRGEGTECYRTLMLHAHVDRMDVHVLNLEAYGRLLRAPAAAAHDELMSYYSDTTRWSRRFINPAVLALVPSPDSARMLLREPAPFVFTMPLFTQAFCDALVERCVARDAWSSGEHADARLPGGVEHVPTRDVHLEQLGLAAVWLDVMHTVVAPYAQAAFQGYAFKRVNLAFVARYTPDTQPHLRPHHDASAFTVVVGLNTGFSGGGTFFEAQKLTLCPGVGQAILHPGRCTHRHGALPVVEGTRYVLVSFCE
jgi:hypothetical protein